jgi:AcrR family transcriptional regulator
MTEEPAEISESESGGEGHPGDPGSRGDDRRRRGAAEDRSTEDVLVDQSGRVLGARARATRQKLLEATHALLDEQSLRDLHVSDIARRVGTSPATFYQYFKDAEDAVLCLARDASHEMSDMVSIVDGSWHGEAGLARARALANAFIDHWDAHHAPLSVRNMAADEGDPRFFAVRRRAMTPVLTALSDRIRRSQKTGSGGAGSRLHPDAAAAAMATILERLAAYHKELEGMGVTRDDLVETTALIVQRTLNGDP